MLIPKHTGWTAQEGSTCPEGAAPRGWGLQQCLEHQTSQAANYVLQRPQNYWESFTCKLESRGCSVAVPWEAELGLFLGKITNTMVRRADLHLGLCLQTCPAPTPMGPALDPATTGS